MPATKSSKKKERGKGKKAETAQPVAPASEEPQEEEEYRSMLDRWLDRKPAEKKGGLTDKQFGALKPTSTSDYIPIKSVRNGVIETTDDRFIRIVEIEPVNYQLQSADERADIIARFCSWLKIAPAKLHFKCVTMSADSQAHIRQVVEDARDEGTKEALTLATNYTELIREVGQHDALTRRFFIIVESELTNVRSPKKEEIYANLDNIVNTIKMYLSKCGNRVIDHEDETQFVQMLLYTLLNRNLAENYNYRTYQTYVNNCYKKYNTIHLNETPLSPSFIDYIAPRSIDFTSGKHTVIDGLYYAYLFFDADGYRTAVEGSWLQILVNAGNGIDIDLFAQKQDKEQFLNRLANKIARNRASVKDVSDTRSDFDALSDTLASSQYLKEAISRYNEDPYYMTVMITVTAYTEKDLEWRVNELKKLLKARDMMLRECRFWQEEAFRSVLPLCNLDKGIYMKSRRNVLTSGLAASYMFTSFELRDDSGVMFGVNRLNNSICTVNPYNSKLHNNANMAILGTSGAGKTFFLQVLASRLRMRGVQTFILAPDKGTEFLRFCNKIGGSYIKISAGSPHCINIMEIRQLDKSNDALIDGSELMSETESSRLAQKITQLHIFFSLLIPDMNYEERQLLDEAIIKTYERKGITHDNNSLFDPTDPTHTRYKLMPTVGDLHDVLAENPDTKRLGIIVNRLVEGSAKSFNQQTNVNTRNQYVVIDLSELTGDLLPVGMFVALDYIWDLIKEDRTKRKAVFIDEAWQLIGESSNKVAAEFVVSIFKKIRAYSGSAICATQDLSDFFSLEDGKYGKTIINNSRTKVILALERQEAESVKDVLQLTQNEVSSIVTSERGEALLCTANCKVAIRVKASDWERKMITTDRRELIAIQREEREKAEAEAAAREAAATAAAEAAANRAAAQPESSE